MTATINDIRSFWDDRARQFGSKARATLNESPLRRLEIRTMIGQIAACRPRRVLDVGCGNGFSTKQFAARFPEIEFFGVDYSEEMIRHAGDDGSDNCRFMVADVLKPQTLPKGTFDLIITQRCLQNIPDYSLQKQAIENLRKLLSSPGKLLLMECSKNGVRQLNKVRLALGRETIGNIQPWHNRFFLDGRMVRCYGAKIIHFSSTYMFLVKVVHPRLAKIALVLPPVGRFGYDKLYVID